MKNNLVTMIKFLMKCGELNTDDAKQLYIKIGYEDNKSIYEILRDFIINYDIFYKSINDEDTVLYLDSLAKDLIYVFTDELTAKEQKDLLVLI